MSLSFQIDKILKFNLSCSLSSYHSFINKTEDSALFYFSSSTTRISIQTTWDYPDIALIEHHFNLPLFHTYFGLDYHIKDDSISISLQDYLKVSILNSVLHLNLPGSRLYELRNLLSNKITEEYTSTKEL